MNSISTNTVQEILRMGNYYQNSLVPKIKTIILSLNNLNYFINTVCLYNILHLHVNNLITKNKVVLSIQEK